MLPIKLLGATGGSDFRKGNDLAARWIAKTEAKIAACSFVTGKNEP